MTQLPMVLGQILQTVEIKIAAETHGGQHKDLPVIKTFASMIRTGIGVDIVRNQLHDFLARCTVTIDVLQREENGYNLVAAVEV